MTTPPSQTPRHPWEITPADTAAALGSDDPPILLDCRESFEVETAVIAGSLHVPMGDIPSRLAELEAHAESPIVVYCHHGVRSLQVVAFLREQGFDDVRSLAGGVDRWSSEIDATVPRY
jgi:rhodanese-related sulfurtransferase